MRTETKNNVIKEELKNIVKKGFDEMLQDVIKGKKSFDDFRKVLDYQYAQKKMELIGRLF